MDNTSLPVGLICGYFDSSEFGSLKISPERISNRFEVEYYLEDGEETYLNGKAIKICADRILIAKPGDLRYSRLPFKTAFLKFCADGELAEMLKGAPTYFPAVHKKQILELIREVTLINEKECEPNISINHELMHRAKKYIETSFCEHISTTDIAKSIDLSESRLRVLFAAVYGVSPHKYLTDVRISAAKEMLWDNDIPLLEIAEKCGFGSQQYFNDTFKKTVGISPGKYRVQFAKKYTDEV